MMNFNYYRRRGGSASSPLDFTPPRRHLDRKTQSIMTKAKAELLINDIFSLDITVNGNGVSLAEIKLVDVFINPFSALLEVSDPYFFRRIKPSEKDKLLQNRLDFIAALKPHLKDLIESVEDELGPNADDLVNGYQEIKKIMKNEEKI